MGHMNAWTSEVNWQTGQWQQRTNHQAPTHHEWHRPSPRGVLAKRPLTFFEVLDSGFRLLRHIPALSIGTPLIIFTLWTLALTAVGVYIALNFLPQIGDIVNNSDAFSGFSLLAQIGSLAVSLLSLGVVHFLAGISALGTENSFGAQKTTLGQAWSALSGRRWTLVLATLLVTLVNTTLLVLLGLPALLFGLGGNFGPAIALSVLGLILWAASVIWLNCRLAFLGPAVAAEKLGLRGAIARSWTLTGRGFWRTLGQLSVGYLLANQLIQLIISPIIIVLTTVATILVATVSIDSTSPAVVIFTVGLSACVLALTATSSAVLYGYFACLVDVCYFDSRMRTEGYDLVLIRTGERTSS